MGWISQISLFSLFQANHTTGLDLIRAAEGQSERPPPPPALSCSVFVQCAWNPGQSAKVTLGLVCLRQLATCGAGGNGRSKQRDFRRGKAAHSWINWAFTASLDRSDVAVFLHVLFGLVACCHRPSCGSAASQSSVNGSLGELHFLRRLLFCSPSRVCFPLWHFASSDWQHH